MTTTLLVVLGLAGLVVLYVIVTYNALVRARNQVREAWSGIEVQMKRRYNLIPNLVETVKGYAAHEQDTLEQVIQARGAAMNNNGTPTEQATDENQLGVALRGLLALSESYPDLKANESFQNLQGELAETEDQIQFARRYYNGVVRDNNTKVDQFPSNLVARAFTFIKAEFFELEESEAAARQPVPVSFD